MSTSAYCIVLCIAGSSYLSDLINPTCCWFEVQCKNKQKRRQAQIGEDTPTHR